ncbi:MAG: hypothetical protein K1X95_05805 [Acidimicrobiia bacterium]|nr:hypothetical protein [Acidimicrobiia bacterium]
MVGEEHQDCVVGSFANLEDAQSALAAFRESHCDDFGGPPPLSWIEQSVRTLTLVHNSA